MDGYVKIIQDWLLSAPFPVCGERNSSFRDHKTSLLPVRFSSFRRLKIVRLFSSMAVNSSGISFRKLSGGNKHASIPHITVHNVSPRPP